jgi:inorganic pyrophosphatase
MKPLTSIEIKLCQLQAKIFENSVKKTKYSSPIFIRRFMLSSIAKSFDEQTFLFQSISTEETFDLLDEEFGVSNYGKTKYTEDQMFWIGYIYRCLSIKYNFSSKTVYNLFNAREIVKHYNIGHTFDIVQAAERMMENINYENDISKKSLDCMRRLIYLESVNSLINKKVTVHIDRPIGFNHDGIIYQLNYGYIKELKTLDNEYQDAYILGEEKPVKIFEGKVIAVIHRLNDNEDKLVVCNNDKEYSNDEIEKNVNFQEKYFKHKIIR